MKVNYDGLVKSISESGEAVVYVIDATNMVDQARRRLLAWPPAMVHLGQAMMAAIFLQALSEKDSDTVSLQWMCEGPFGHLYAEARNYGQVRGTIGQPQAPDIYDFKTLLGPGLLQARRSSRETVTSVVKAIGDVSLDVVEYLEKSEQRNAGMNLSVKVEWADDSKSDFRIKHALGYMIDVLPQPTPQLTEDALVRWNRQMNDLKEISKWVLRPERRTLDMLEIITGEEAAKILMKQRVEFSCNCTEDRASRALSLLDQMDGEKSAQPQEVRCEYCGKVYYINTVLSS